MKLEPTTKKQMVEIVHSVHSSSLHLTRLTCLQEVDTSPSHQILHFLPHHYLTHWDDVLLAPNLLKHEVLKTKASFDWNIVIEPPTQGHF